MNVIQELRKKIIKSSNGHNMINATSVINNLEKISYALAEIEQIIQYEDKRITEVLRKLIGTIFWNIEVPLEEKFPEVNKLIVIGRKYKNCIFKVIEYNKKTGQKRIIENNVSVDNIMNLLSTERKRISTNHDLFVEINYCYSLQADTNTAFESSIDQWIKYRSTITSKEKSALVMNKLEKIYYILGQQMAFYIKNQMLVKVLSQIMGDILTDIYYPILRVYPSLVPVGLFEEKKHKGYTYNIVEHNWKSGSNVIKASGILPNNAISVFTEQEKDIKNIQDSFMYLELIK